MIKHGFLLLILLVAAAPVHAQNQCYSPAEMEAEQLLRLHSELMVITVTCHQSSVGDNLVPYYTNFTKINIKALHNAEQTMMKYYKSIYGGTGVDWLDKLRTRLGNEFGQAIADISAPQFCADRRDKVIAMCNATARELEAEVERLKATAKPYERLCADPHAHVAKDAE